VTPPTPDSKNPKTKRHDIAAVAFIFFLENPK
jgi:hypothetical protein